MRLGVGIPLGPDTAGPDLVAEAAHAEAAGLDAVWIEEDDGASPLVAAASLGAATTAIRVGVTVALGDAHPLYVAEEAAVADLALSGRLVLGVAPAPLLDGDEARFDEAVALVGAAHRSRPFRHDGPEWRVPARLPGNTANREGRLRVTPSPLQIVLPTVVVGAPRTAVAARRGLPVMATRDEGPDVMADAWHTVEAACGPAADRMPRAAHRVLAADRDAGIDAGATAAALRGERDRWGLDLAILWMAGADRRTRLAAIEAVGRRVRPRVQLDTPPPLLAT